MGKATIMDALRRILATDDPDPRRTENRDPTPDELNKRWRLHRRDGQPVG